jgi:hypothetical protein
MKFVSIKAMQDTQTPTDTIANNIQSFQEQSELDPLKNLLQLDKESLERLLRMKKMSLEDLQL